MNTQLPMKYDNTDGQILSVHSIFATIQGEGPLSGRRAVFVRLTGCNLQCPGCDTEYTKNDIKMSLEDIWQSVSDASKTFQKMNKYESTLVVITGGEPFRQNIRPLIEKLCNEKNCLVQVETNGTMPVPDFALVDLSQLYIVCSPKTSTVHESLLKQHPSKTVDAWKYVVEHEKVDSADGLPTSVLGNNVRPARPSSNVDNEDIYVTPFDSNDTIENLDNAREAAKTCMKFGYILNLQIHKYCDLP